MLDELKPSYKNLLLLKYDLGLSYEEIAMMLKKSNKPIILACNKSDNYGEPPAELYEFYNLGLGDPHPVSAANAIGIGDLLDEIYNNLKTKSLRKPLLASEGVINAVPLRNYTQSVTKPTRL